MELPAGMVDDAAEGEELQFRDDILRGVRLFLIAFAAILIGVWAYRMLRIPSEVQGASQQELPTAPDASQPSEDLPAETAVAGSSPIEPHGLTVPPPPPVGGTHVSKAPRPAKAAVPVAPATPPVVAKARKPVAPSGREFEAAEPGALPAAPAEESGDASPSSPRQGVGYKSLLEADPNRAPEPALLAGVDPPVEKPKGNRLLRAVGKIFRPGGKKETVPLTLQQK
jgi:cytoskeletal protein RodZ